MNLTAGPEPGHDKRCHCHKPVTNVSFTEGKRRKRDAGRERKQVKEDPMRKRGAAEGLPFNLDKGLLSIEYICRIFFGVQTAYGEPDPCVIALRAPSAQTT